MTTDELEHTLVDLLQEARAATHTCIRDAHAQRHQPVTEHALHLSGLWLDIYTAAVELHHREDPTT